eukprot:scpid109132/ scgid7711/ 
MVREWSPGCIRSDWRYAHGVPIPKKGNLRVCDNWCGISLLDIAGKLFARIIQDRLEEIEFCQKTQCGFRKGRRGCVNVFFFLVHGSLERRPSSMRQICMCFS